MTAESTPKPAIQKGAPFLGETQRGRGDDRAGERLEEIGNHAGDVADVVTDVVGDGGGVARVVLRDVRLHLADEIGPTSAALV